MCACGEIGKERADQVLIRVPLKLSSHSAQAPTMDGEPKSILLDGDTSKEDEAARVRAGDVVGVLKDVNQCCFEYQREEVRRMVCRVRSTISFPLSSLEFTRIWQIAGKTLMTEKQYGLAISYYASAEDWPGLGRVVDRVLAEYVAQGPAKFTRLVAEIAPSLQTLRKSASASNYSLNGIFLHRLVFIVKYAEFHQRRMSNDLVEAAADLVGMFEEDVVPCQWWGVLLYDSADLLNYREQYSY